MIPLIPTREEVVRVAMEWNNTPYVSNACTKGAGVDCAMLFVGVFKEAGFLDPDYDPRPYPTQWHLHQSDEKFMKIVQGFATEIAGPPGLADLILFKIGRVFAHGAICLGWPVVIHAFGPAQRVRVVDITQNSIGRHALGNLERRFFSPWS